jgi:hypothetical protein
MLGLSYPLEEYIDPSIFIMDTICFMVVTLLGVKFTYNNKFRAYHERYNMKRLKLYFHKGFKKHVDRPITRQTGEQMNARTQNERGSVDPDHITE